MADFNNYDPKNIVAIWGSITLSGFIDGSFIKVERKNDTFSMQEGVLGDVTRVRSHKRSGRVTFSLMQGSLVNDLLSAAHRSDELAGDAYDAFMIQDLNGNTLLTAPNAWLVKPADTEFSNEGSPREWMLDCDELIGVTGGHIV